MSKDDTQSPSAAMLVMTAAALTFSPIESQSAPADDMRSKFSVAASHLGFSDHQQKAILRIFTMNGSFTPNQMWDDVIRSKIFGDRGASVFTSNLYQVVHRSHADAANPNDFNVEYLHDHLFGKAKIQDDIDISQVEKWILYVAQKAFARPKDTERNELKSQNWMGIYKKEFFEAARVLDLVDRINPQHKIYDQTWIAGASRPGVIARVIDYVLTSQQHEITITGDVKILAGVRELWAEIDGMSPDVLEKLQKCFDDKGNVDDVDVTVVAQSDDIKTADGIKYMIDLAKKNGIELVDSLPVIKYATKDECPVGRFPGRTYLNYKDPSGLKVDESMMSRDILAQYGMHGVDIVHTKASEDARRPTTETTAQDAAALIIENIRNGVYKDQTEFIIFFESNNPYIHRQGLAAQAAVDKALQESGLKGYTITIDSVGFRNKQDVTTVSSELAAYVNELYKYSIGDVPIELTYQGRDHKMVVSEYHQ
jgi:hypothetical protein